MDLTLILFSVALTTVLLIIFSEVSSWIRHKIPVKVQCWFCHFKYTVKYTDVNSWVCPDCDQYNGFDKDGGYNKVIPNQHDERLNISVTSFGRKKRNWNQKVASLCSHCNYNQELKVKQLASFTPINERKYDEEVEHYRAQLEDSYRLCRKCEQLVAQIISKQKQNFSGPRRLVQASKKLIFRSSLTIYLSLVLSILLSMSLLPTVSCSIGWLPLYFIPAAQPLTAAGVLLNTILFCHFRSLWAFFDWSTWVIMASMPHLLKNQDTQLVSLMQVSINICIFFYNGIILLRRKKYERLFNSKEKKRQERRKMEDSAFMKSMSYSDFQRKVPVESKKENNKLTRRSLLKPVPRKSEDLDMSRLSLGSIHTPYRREENPFNRHAWDPPGMTRSSSFSSGISLTPPGSPVSSPYNRSRNNWGATPPQTGIKEGQSWCSPLELSDHSRSWHSAKSQKESSWPQPATQWTPPGWSSVEQPCQLYPSSYPVTYYYSHQCQKPAPSPMTSYLVSSLPTLILAATNAALVYIIYTKDIKT